MSDTKSKSYRWTIESAWQEPGPSLHPLAGASLKSFKSRYRQGNGYTARSRKQRTMAWLLQYLRAPGSAYEDWRHSKHFLKKEITEPPIFLIGHWRSGTTHLHNLMSRDPQFGYIDFGQTAMPWDMIGKTVTIGRGMIDKVLPETRGYDNVKLSLDEPQEEEMALGNLNDIGYYNIYYFPERTLEYARQALFFEGVSDEAKAEFERSYAYLVRKLNYVKKDKRLLFKNPPSTTRIPLLKKLFPEAKFVHIVRNPFPVYRSSIGKFPRLYNAFAWEDFREFDIHGFTIDTYEQLMKRYLEDRKLLSENDLVETSYEKVTADPMGEINRIYDALGIDRKNDGLSQVQTYVDTIKDYQPNAHRMSRAHVEEIQDRWGFSFEHWDYPLEPPSDVVIED